jgi:threonyl-tRNA synthetase
MDNKPNSLDSLRHSTSHLLAAAVLEIYPDAKLAIGPSIENGFYYDIDFGDFKISEEDFPKIEDKMKELIPSWDSFNKLEFDGDEAKKQYKTNPYKEELIEEFSEKGKKKVGFYESVGSKSSYFNGKTYRDLCKGGHTDNPSKEIKYFKLLSVAGAYWRGDEKNKMLTRIYGTVFPTQKELDEYLNQLEEAKKRDHRKLGKELDLFTFSDLVGSGMPLYTPKGALIRRLLNNFIEEEQTKLGYTQVWTPQIAKGELFKISGHYDKYKDDMFTVHSHYSKEEFFLKPMNCPQHTQIYASKARSYKDLPLRYSDFAMLYRDEKPGELNGLARVRSFSQDDCHIFCREDQVDEEIDKALSMTKQVMNIFGFQYRYRLSTRDPNDYSKYLGDMKTWDKVEKWSVEIMKRNKIDYFDGPGEAAFYAPKMDLMATDALGREWQLSTIQIDFVMPERFGLEYTNDEGQKSRPVMIHRAVLGSSERVLMILIEHFAGAFPVWLAPVQVKILPITDRNLTYSKGILEQMKKHGIRAEMDDRSETLGSKIRDANSEKLPYMIITGDKEESAKKIAVRERGGHDLGQIDLDKFIKKLEDEVNNKLISLDL